MSAYSRRSELSGVPGVTLHEYRRQRRQLEGCEVNAAALQDQLTRGLRLSLSAQAPGRVHANYLGAGAHRRGAPPAFAPTAQEAVAAAAAPPPGARCNAR